MKRRFTWKADDLVIRKAREEFVETLPRWYEATVIRKYLHLEVGRKVWIRKSIYSNLVVLFLGDCSDKLTKEEASAYFELGIPSPGASEIEYNYQQSLSSFSAP